MRFGVLGTVEVVDDGREIDVGGSQQRTVLAVLLAAAGRVVPADAIADCVWGDDPPPSAAATLQTYVSRLRRLLEPARAPGGEAKVLLWDPPGYRLVVDAADVDFRRFELLADEGRALLDAGEAADAQRVLVEADRLWRGPALLEYADQEFAAGLAARLEERRIAATEHRIEADLRLGRHATVAPELAELVRRYPLREGLRAHLALALYRSGRQAEALRAIDDARRTLREELGVDPGRTLRELEAAILAHDAALDVEVEATVPPVAAVPAAAPPAPTTELVGRQRELDALLAPLAAARSTHLAIVEGEPGIGKTRLLEEVAAEAGRRGALVAWGRCHEGGAAPAFWPWLGVLRTVLGTDGAGGDRSVESLLAPGEGASGGDSGDARFLLFESVAARLEAVAAHRPLVVLLDDLQWADPASLELLGFLAGRLVDTAILLIGTVRELEMGRNDAVVNALATVSRRPGSRRLQLSGLDADDTAALLAQATGRPVSPSLADVIHARADGNPFYATELARLLAGDELALAGLPAGVRDVVRHRLAQLPGATVELLDVAAVVGRDIDLAVLAEAADRSLDACLDDLEPAVVHRLLHASPGRPGAFRFAHALVREVVVDGLTPLRRSRIHLRVADAIEGLAGGSDDVAEIVADHLWSAVSIGAGERAADALERAAQVALRRLAYESGEDLLDRALQLRRSTGRADAELRVASELVKIRRARRGMPAVAGTPLLDRAKELAEQVGDTELLVDLLWVEWAGFDVACDVPRSRALARQLHDLGLASGHGALEAVGRVVWGINCWHQGHLHDAAAEFDIAAELAAANPRPSTPLGFDVDHRLSGLGFGACAHTMIGDRTDGEARLAAVAAELKERMGSVQVLAFDAFTALTVGDHERAERSACRALAIDPDVTLGFWSTQVLFFLATALFLRGDVDEGLAVHDRAMALQAGSGIHSLQAFFIAVRAEALADCGRVEEAAAVAAEARAELDVYGERWAEPVVLEAEAIVAHASGADPDRVAALVRQAVELAEAQGARAVAARVVERTTSLGLPH